MRFCEETRKKMSLARIGRKLPESTKAKMRGRIPWNKGKTGFKHTDATKLKMSKTRKGKKTPWLTKIGTNNRNWKGKNASYRTKHRWMVNHYGQPTTCEHCQTGNLTGHQIHWANISGEYRRDRTDWLRLCSKCHGLFDKRKRNKII